MARHVICARPYAGGQIIPTWPLVIEDCSKGVTSAKAAALSDEVSASCGISCWPLGIRKSTRTFV